MIGRAIVTGLLALALSGCNGLIGNGYSHVVDRPQKDVVAALDDLDIFAQPGAPISGPELSGGVTPDIRLEKAADHMTWWVMAGDKVATVMTATFEPVDGGKRTRVTTSVKRGDAPDAIVSPTFQSVSVTSGLFAVAVETELTKMTAPAHASAEECRQLIEVWRRAGEAEATRDEPGSLTEAIGDGARTAIRIRALENAMRQHGCPMDGTGKFGDVSNEMGTSDRDFGSPSPYRRDRSKPDTAGDGIPDDN